MATHSTPEQEGQCAHYVPLLVPVFWLKIGMWRWNRWREGRGGRRLGGRAAKLFQVKLLLRSCPEFRLRRFDLVKNPSGFQALVLLILARHTGLLKVCLRSCRRIVKAPWHCSGCFLPPQWHISTLILTGSREETERCWGTTPETPASPRQQVRKPEAESWSRRSGISCCSSQQKVEEADVWTPRSQSDGAFKGEAGITTTEQEKPIEFFLSSISQQLWSQMVGGNFLNKREGNDFSEIRMKQPTLLMSSNTSRKLSNVLENLI